MSGGTLLALAADEVVMDRNAVLGPVDPQLGQHAAASILKVLEEMSRDGVNQLPVMSDGRVLGMLSREDVVSFIRTLRAVGA